MMKTHFSVSIVFSIIIQIVLASPAFAGYTPADPKPGDTVTFIGPCDGLVTSVSSLTINILEGATVQGETEGLGLSGNHYAVTNRGSIRGGDGTMNPHGDDGIDIDGQDSWVENYGWIRGDDHYGANLGGSGTGIFRLYNYNTISGWEDGVVLTGTNGIIQNYGEIIGDAGNGVRSHVAGIIDNWGTVSGGSIGALITGPGSTSTINHEGATISAKSPWSWAGVYLDGANNTLINNGKIESDGHGIVFKSTNTNIANTGEIIAGNRGIYSYAEALNSTFDNSGSITSDSFGVFFDSAGTVFDNSGTVHSGTQGVRMGAANQTINNSGTITGLTEGIFVESGVTNAVIKNKIGGTINGPIAIMGNDERQRITNNGTINGNVILNDGDDDFYHAGAINGNVFLGSGNDNILVDLEAATANSMIDGGSDTDELVLYSLGDRNFDFGKQTNFETLKIQGGGIVNAVGPIMGSVTIDDGLSVELREGSTLKAHSEYIGYDSEGTFTQVSGENNVEEILTLGVNSGSTGTYNLEDGTLRAKNEIISFRGDGTFIQKDGVNQVVRDISLSGGELVVGDITATGKYELQGGEIYAYSEFIGRNGGKGEFFQTGGKNNVTQYLRIDSTVSSPKSSYTMSNGELIVGDILFIDGESTFSQTGGTVKTGEIRFVGDGKGRYELGGGSLSANSIAVLDGLVKHTDNALSVVNVLLDIGYKGEYELSGKAGLLSDSAKIHHQGKFTQTGVIHSVGRSLRIESGGTYDISDGILGIKDNLTIESQRVFDDLYQSQLNQTGGYVSMDNLIVDQEGLYTLSEDGDLLVETDEIIGDTGIGTFRQTGGTNDVESRLILGKEEGSHGTYEMKDGELTVVDERIGVGGTGVFTQNAGSHTVTRTLSLGGEKGSKGTYELNDGNLTAFDIDVGNYSASTGLLGDGEFIQSKGTVKAITGLAIDYNGQYDLKDGTLIAGEVANRGIFKFSGGALNLGGDGNGTFFNDGEFHLSGGGVRTVNGYVVTLADSIIKESDTTVRWKDLDLGGWLSTDPSSNYFTNLTIEPTGCIVSGLGDNFYVSNNFINNSTQATLWDTTDAHLGFIGGGLHDFYITGLDFGPDPLGYIDNFSWGSFEIADGGTLNLFGDPGESLYVDTLRLSAGSMLNLNGINLYYYNFINEGGSYTGGELNFVPEPSSVFLLSLGLLSAGAGFLKRRHLYRSLS